MKFTKNYIILFLILLGLGILYKWFDQKMKREEKEEDYRAIQDYFLDDVTLGKSKKPILWIHVPREYNARNWQSFGSRSSYDLNQPYLYLTVRSIIKNCSNSFTICLIDDQSFSKLIEGWTIDMTNIANPILSNMRTLGLMKLLYRYGGMICPISFLCIKDLQGLYEKGTRNNSMFVCEFIDRNITSTTNDFYPSLKFCGAPKENETVSQLIDFIQRIMSKDFTDQSVFLGDFDRWVNARINSKSINLIPGIDIGVRTTDNKQILIEDLLGNNYLNIYTQAYGIYIPANEILNRTKYQWFARMSEKQVMESDTIIGNYILITIAEGGGNILEPLEIKPDWVHFWRVPSGAPMWGLKPNFLGDNIPTLEYPGR
jgi:hypothetical protein